MWAIFVPIVIITKIERTIPGKTGLSEFALFIRFVTSRKQRRIGHVFVRHFSIIFWRTVSLYMRVLAGDVQTKERDKEREGEREVRKRAHLKVGMPLEKLRRS